MPISMTTAYCSKRPQAIFFKLLLHSSNLLIVARMEVKLGVHVYYIVSITQALFFKITSSLIKLANYSTHGGETWCLLSVI